MILADTTIWIDHFRVANLKLSRALEDDVLLMHPYVVVELALGSLKNRARAIERLKAFQSPPVVNTGDVLILLEQKSLFSKGIGFVDLHLLASCLSHDDCKLLTRDRRLQEAAERLGVAT